MSQKQEATNDHPSNDPHKVVAYAERTDNDKAREAFERWYCKGDDVMTFVPWHDLLDEPDDHVACMAWRAWQAAIESQRLALEEKDAEIERLQSRVKELESLLDSQGITINEQSR